MKQKRPKYQSYLIRLWRSSDDETAPWHMMLENLHSHERYSFASLGELKAFLHQLIAASNPISRRRNARPGCS